MAYILTLLCRSIGCPRPPSKRVMTDRGEIVGDYCTGHAGAEFVRQDDREKGERKGVRRRE